MFVSSAVDLPACPPRSISPSRVSTSYCSKPSASDSGRQGDAADWSEAGSARTCSRWRKCSVSSVPESCGISPRLRNRKSVIALRSTTSRVTCKPASSRVFTRNATSVLAEKPLTSWLSAMTTRSARRCRPRKPERASLLTIFSKACTTQRRWRCIL